MLVLRSGAVVLITIAVAAGAAADIEVHRVERLDEVRITACDEPVVLASGLEMDLSEGTFADDLGVTSLGASHVRQVSTVTVAPDEVRVWGSVAAFVDRDTDGGCEGYSNESRLVLEFTPGEDATMTFTDTRRPEWDGHSTAFLRLATPEVPPGVIFTLPAVAFSGEIELAAGVRHELVISAGCFATVEHAVHAACGCMFDITIAPDSSSPVRASSWSDLRARYR